MKIEVKKGVAAPIRKHSTDAGIDFHSPEDKQIGPHQQIQFKSGVKVELPKGHVMIIKERSSVAKRGIIIGASVIDEGYRGEITIDLINTSMNPFIIHRGDRIAQGIVIPINYVKIELGIIESDTERGDSGFGSTGK